MHADEPLHGAGSRSAAAHPDAPTAAPHGRDRFPRGLQLLGAASGLLFVLFLILSIVLGDAEAPDWGAPGAEYQQYAADNGDDFKLGLLLSLFSAFALLWFAAFLRSELGDAERRLRGFTRVAHVVLLGAAISAIGIVLSASMRAAATNQPGDTPGEVIRAMVHLADSVGALLPLGLAALLIGAGLLQLLTREFPAWLGVLALVAGVAYVVLFLYALVIDEQDSAIDIAWPIAFLGLLIWSIATSVLLLGRVGRSPAGDGAPRAPAP
jgi:hypothetical protein